MSAASGAVSVKQFMTILTNRRSLGNRSPPVASLIRLELDAHLVTLPPHNGRMKDPRRPGKPERKAAWKRPARGQVKSGAAWRNLYDLAGCDCHLAGDDDVCRNIGSKTRLVLPFLYALH